MAAFTEEEVGNIVSVDRSTGRLKLAKILKLKEYNEENDLKAAIYIDFLYDNILFTAEKGFSWSQVCYAMQFAQEFLHDCQGKPLSGAVRSYKENSENLVIVLGERNYKVYTDYIFSTFLSHYQLFTYVFAQERQTDVPTVSLNVHVPVPPEELKNGKTEDIWKYEKKIEEMEDVEVKKTEERVLAREKSVDEEKTKKQTTEEKFVSVEQPYTKETLGALINDVLQSYTASTAMALTSTVRETGEDLELMLGKSSVPRPQALGPPPRYKLKTPINVNTKSANKNRPNKSRDSGRSSRNTRSPKSTKSKT